MIAMVSIPLVLAVLIIDPPSSDQLKVVPGNSASGNNAIAVLSMQVISFNLNSADQLSRLLPMINVLIIVSFGVMFKPGDVTVTE
jgi:hypothetical protein